MAKFPQHFAVHRDFLSLRQKVRKTEAVSLHPQNRVSVPQWSQPALHVCPLLSLSLVPAVVCLQFRRLAPSDLCISHYLQPECLCSVIITSQTPYYPKLRWSVISSKRFSLKFLVLDIPLPFSTLQGANLYQSRTIRAGIMARVIQLQIYIPYASTSFHPHCCLLDLGHCSPFDWTNYNLL